MKKFVMRYPEDPPCEVLRLSRAEFFQMFPQAERFVRVVGLTGSGDMVLHDEIPMGETICCDSCNGDPGDSMWLVDGSTVHCDECYGTSLAKYTTEVA